MYTNRHHVLATSWAPILSANWLLLLRRLLLVLLLLLVLVVLGDYPLREHGQPKNAMRAPVCELFIFGNTENAKKCFC